MNIRFFAAPPLPSASDPAAMKLPVPAPREDFMAIEPSALERLFAPHAGMPGDDGEELPYEVEGALAIIRVSGPLMQRGGSFWFWSWDGYDTIRSRFEAALANPAIGAVLLHIDSCGGVVSGCFEAVRSMRAAKAAADKPVLAFADEAAYSAAYALASVADEIYLPPEGGVGSVGVIGVLEDWTGYNEKAGIRVAVITSGARKADGHPDAALSDEVVARYQARIDALGETFAGIVGESRGMTTKQVLALQAGCFYGTDAVAKGLANDVMSFEACEELAGNRAVALLAARAQAKAPVGVQTKGTSMKTAEQNAAHAPSATVSLLGSTLALIVALGLKSDTDEPEAIARAQSLSALERDLLAETGKKTIAEALGVVGAWKEDAEKLVEARTEMKKIRDGQDAAEATSLIKAAVGDGRVAPAKVEKVEAIFTKHGLDGLKSHLDALTPIPALASRSPEQRAPSTDDGPRGGGGGREEFTADEKTAMREAGLSEEKWREAKGMLGKDGLYMKPDVGFSAFPTR